MDISPKRLFLKYRTPLVMVVLGFLLLIAANSLNSGEVMSSNLRLLRYISLILLSFALFLLFIKGKKVVWANIALFGLLILIVEITCFFMLGRPSAVNKDFEQSIKGPDHIGTRLGTVPYADSVYHKVLVKENDTVFDVNITIDKNSLRVTPNHLTEKENFALFFGCSITYGYGLEDYETLPHHFQSASSEHNAYNYAFEGYSANQMLARMEYQDLSADVVEKDGIAFYVFFWDHIYRAIGSMERYCDWVSSSPYYEFENGELVRNKTFKNGRPLVSKFYELVYQTNIIKKFEIGFPSELRDDHYDLVSEIILKAKKTYESQFGNDDFYVVFYPSYKKYTDEQLSRFMSFLDDKNIDYIDLSNVIEYGPRYTLKGDPHPNSETNRLISDKLLERIKQ